MKITILGGGTAGFIAAAHLSRDLPDAELLHVYDSHLPTIGVGEGTTPRFPVWFHEVTGLGFPELAERCGATLKRGTLFDGWGPDGEPFLNRFHPTRLVGYHFDASKVVEVLGEHVRAEHVDGRVDEVRTLATGVEIRMADGGTRRSDYLFDARGFPKASNSTAGAPHELIRLDWVPTGRAILRWLPPGRLSGATRAAARPHGWIFHIPLAHATSTGYIFNPRISTDAEVEADYDAFLAEEGVEGWTHRGQLDFPNFMRRRVFDGRVFHLGNSASFLEPLEATAIGTTIVEIRAAAHWIREHGPAGAADRREVDEFNGSMQSFICRNSLFIAWHYTRGSRWDTPFWRYAAQGLERAGRSDAAHHHLAAMDEFVAAGRRLPGHALSRYDDEAGWERDIFPLLSVYRPYGNFSELNFAQVGHGIGCYKKTSRAAPAARRRGATALATGP